MRYDFDKTPATYFHQDIPTTAVPANAKERPHSLTLQASGWKPQTPPTQPVHHPTASIFHAIPVMQPWEQSLLEHFQFLIDENQAWHILSTQQCIIATDGSAPDPKGSLPGLLAPLQVRGLRNAMDQSLDSKYLPTEPKDTASYQYSDS
jgi:hypothetical protein